MVLYLIGMMGSGKTTIGKILSEKMGFQFIDTDQLIEEKTQQKISQIINEKGINVFRKIEQETLYSLDIKDAVISTGGGIILDDANRRFMKKHGYIIYLDVSLETLNRRLNETEKHNRPLLKTQSLETIYQDRKYIYEKTADLVMNGELSADDICLFIINHVKKQGN